MVLWLVLRGGRVGSSRPRLLLQLALLAPATSACPSWCESWSCDGSSWCRYGAVPRDCESCARTGHGTDWCRESSSRSRSVRDRFHKPEGFASCAVIGSSGILLQQRLGAEIDAHDFVLRTNLAQVGGFEAIVGRKTSARVMNSEAIQTVLLERACPELKHGRASFCDGLSYGVFVNSATWGMKEALRDACGSHALSPILGWDDVPPSDPTIQHFQRHGGNVMTGAWAIALAMYLCPNGMDVYGFTHSANAKESRGAQYHCAQHARSTALRAPERALPVPTALDPPCLVWGLLLARIVSNLFVAPADYDYNGIRQGVDSLSGTSLALDSLAASQPSCVRLHAPSGLTTEPACAEDRARRDPLIDGIRHSFSPSTYAQRQVPSLKHPVHWCPSLPPSPPASRLCHGCPGIGESAGLDPRTPGSCCHRPARLSPALLTRRSAGRHSPPQTPHSSMDTRPRAAATMSSTPFVSAPPPRASSPSTRTARARRPSSRASVARAPTRATSSGGAMRPRRSPRMACTTRPGRRRTARATSS